MNNLKFRARDVVTGKILEQAYMGQCFQWVNHEKQSNIVIEQFTGFKDANGREVYLGDDLLLEGYGSFIRKPYTVKYNTHDGCYWLDTAGGGLALNALDASSSFVVDKDSEDAKRNSKWDNAHNVMSTNDFITKLNDLRARK